MQKNALLSVADKNGLPEFIKNKLNGYNIFASSGTKDYLLKYGIQAKTIDEIPGVNPMLGGLVKTLSYSLLAGILFDRDNKDHVNQMKDLPSIDLVVCNFYPEEIDIGGPNMIRASLKNWKHVTAIVDPKDYEKFDASQIDREYFRMKAYNYLFQDLVSLSHKGISKPLTYGENPHQKAYLASKEFDLSFNNIRDIEAGLSLVSEAKTNALAVIKHQIPCCYIESKNFEGNELLERAFEIDSTSAYGGVVVSNTNFEKENFPKKFLDIIVSPNKTGNAKKLVELPKMASTHYSALSTFAGLLVQEKDTKVSSNYTVQAGEKIDHDLAQFSERLIKSFKSNAIIITMKTNKGDLLLLGQGSGEPNRVDCFTRLALPRAEEAMERLKEFYPEVEDKKRWLVFSDGFFPFADSIEAMFEEGIRNIIEPGGSKRDQEVVDYAKKQKINLSFCEYRHFTH